MSGINRIQTKRETRYQGGQDDTRMPGRELFFKDGDQAFMSIVATGDEDDPKLADYWMYTFNEEGRWNSVLGGTKNLCVRSAAAPHMWNDKSPLLRHLVAPKAHLPPTGRSDVEENGCVLL